MVFHFDMPKTYPIIKEMYKSFRTHPKYGYTIEVWEFEPVVKWWPTGTRRPASQKGASHWSKNAGR